MQVVVVALVFQTAQLVQVKGVTAVADKVVALAGRARAQAPMLVEILAVAAAVAPEHLTQLVVAAMAAQESLFFDIKKPLSGFFI
jgi:signal recognition particle GTPase